jgi:prepilin-type N-terminal cleavage/methylation domain-containing protein
LDVRPSALRPSPSAYRGLTLIELLVVIIILTTIVAAAIPIMAPANDDRQLREAARGINTFLTGAQAQAISLGRPYGVALKRLSVDTNQGEDNGVCLEMFYAEQQPPFAGFDRNSKACVANTRQPGLALVSFVKDSPGSPKSIGLPIGIVPDLFPNGMFWPGDVIEINGTRFEMLDHRLPANGGNNVVGENVDFDMNGYYATPSGASQLAVSIVVRPINDSGQQIKIKHDRDGFPLGADRPASAPVRPADPYWTAPAAYRILRQPTITSDEPYQLPEGTAIDLRASGVGSNEYFHVPLLNDNRHNVYIMFAPEGRVSRVSFSQLPNNTGEPDSFDEPVVDNVFLLVGKRENIPAPQVGSDPTLNTTMLPAAGSQNYDELVREMKEPINWLNGFSRWIVIGSQSGRIVTIENAAVDLPAVAALASTIPEVKRNRQIAAAREFTREMSQLGGR